MKTGVKLYPKNVCIECYLKAMKSKYKPHPGGYGDEP
jgi:hypothetical protein